MTRSKAVGIMHDLHNTAYTLEEKIEAITTIVNLPPNSLTIVRKAALKDALVLMTNLVAELSQELLTARESAE